MPTIMLADDHTLVRNGLRLLLEQAGFPVVGEVGDGLAAVELAQRLRPDLAIMDLSMPLMNGVGASNMITKDPGAATKVILLTMHSEQSYVMAALAAGVRGYVLKKRAASDLLEAIGEVQKGNIFLSPEISRSVLDAMEASRVAPDPKAESEALSDREMQVLQLVVEGMRTKAIADLLSISGKTVESHRTRIMQKLNIHDTAGLVLYAIRKGIIEA